MSVWRSRSARASSLLARLRRDGQLPRSTSAVIVGALRGRAISALHLVVASLRPAVGNGSEVVRVGSRRWRVLSAQRLSQYELALDHACTVVKVLRDRDVDSFVVSFDDRFVELGIPYEQRSAAVDALVADAQTRDFGARWRFGVTRGEGVVAKHARWLRQATHWELFTRSAFGDTMMSDRAATVVSFWDVGSSGMRERVGERGQARFPIDAADTVEHLGGRALPGKDALPVERAVERTDVTVDVVFTWVDDSDPAWRAAYNQAKESTVAPDVVDSAIDARFADHDELRYALRSVYFYCGFARNIYLVTAGQRPHWLRDHPRVTIIDHREILPHSALPTFNSHAIESAIHKIDGLSEHFIYFNDDFFVARPLSRAMFFEPGGNPRVFLSDARVPSPSATVTRGIDHAASVGRRLADRMFDRVPAFKPAHAPYSLRRSMLANIESKFADEIDATRSERFRSPDNVSLPASFAGVWGIASGESVPAWPEVKYTDIESHRLGLNLEYFAHGPQADFFCLNSTEKQSRDHAHAVAKVVEFLQTQFPEPAPWEHDVVPSDTARQIPGTEP